MKEFICLFLCLILVFSLWGCRSGDTPTVTPPGANNLSADTETVYDRPVAYQARYVRTDGYHDGVKYPQVAVIPDRTALDAYYNANKDLYSLGRNPNPANDCTKGFLDICDSYDERFFSEKYLVLILLEEGSGSIRHSVEEVTGSSDGKLQISILREVPEIGTADMAEWHIVLEMDKASSVPSEKDVSVYLDGGLAWNGEVVDPLPPDAPYSQPPQGLVITPEGESPLLCNSYAWFYRKNGEITEAKVADAAFGPPPATALPPVTIDSKYAETVYLPIPGTDTYEPTNTLGYKIKFYWDAQPSRVECKCWPDTYWKNTTTDPESLPFDPLNIFYAKNDGYIYELTATWDDDGSGFYGTATYYTYILPTAQP